MWYASTTEETKRKPEADGARPPTEHASYGQSSVEIPPPPPPRLVEASGTAAEILKLVNQDSAAPARVDLESSPHDVSAKPGETDENKINSDNVGVKDRLLSAIINLRKNM